jgi:hypothetical protein
MLSKPKTWMPGTRPGMTSFHRKQRFNGHPSRAFPAECCFQVIYFNPNISFLSLIAMGLAPGVKTTRLGHAVKNTGETGEPLFLGIPAEG